jgi:hypothetical protein
MERKSKKHFAVAKSLAEFARARRDEIVCFSGDLCVGKKHFSACSVRMFALADDSCALQPHSLEKVLWHFFDSFGGRENLRLFPAVLSRDKILDCGRFGIAFCGKKRIIILSIGRICQAREGWKGSGIFGDEVSASASEHRGAHGLILRAASPKRCCCLLFPPYDVLVQSLLPLTTALHKQLLGFHFGQRGQYGER